MNGSTWLWGWFWISNNLGDFEDMPKMLKRFFQFFNILVQVLDSGSAAVLSLSPDNIDNNIGIISSEENELEVPFYLQNIYLGS